MPRTRFRHALALVTAAAVLATMTAATVAAPASAARPKCQGKVATIVGTARNDILRGTARRDVIVAKGGADRIYARGGNDLICAGTGDDRVFGGVGADTIWGQAGDDILNGNSGNDFLAGQIGDDTLNGGLQTDTCYQGTGSGAVLNCELPALAPAPPPAPPTADLAVDVVCPGSANPANDITCSITVTNLGPDASAYTLDVGEATNSGAANCDALFDKSAVPFPSLAKGGVRTGDYSIRCTDPTSGSTEKVYAEVVAAVTDPVVGNNYDEEVMSFS